MALLNKEKTVRSLRRNPGILRALLHNVDQHRAETATDGPDGWSVLFIVCHITDYEVIYTERVRRILAEDEPQFETPLDNDQMPIANHYAEQQLHEMVANYEQRRREFSELLEGLNDEQLARRGFHPSSGYGTALEYGINAALHDGNHFEQIAKALGIGKGLD